MANYVSEIRFGYKGKVRTVHSHTTEQRFKEIRETRSLTKQDIENLAKDIKLWARENKVGDEYSLFYNGKFWYMDYQSYFDENNNYVLKKSRKTKKDADPHKWCEWFSEKFILGFAIDGRVYEVLNYGHLPLAEEKLRTLIGAYGLYLECCDYCYWEVCCDNVEIENVEYTYWPKEKIEWLYRPENAPDEEIKLIMEHWYELAKATGDIGACTIGEYMEFVYKGKRYRMCPQTPYQGDYSWSAHVSTIKNLLTVNGATEIYMNYGRLD